MKFSKILSFSLGLILVFLGSVGFLLPTDQGLGLFPSVAQAQTSSQSSYSGEYQFLEPLELEGFGGEEGAIDVSSEDSFPNYVNTIIQVIIGIAIALAVIMVIVGGVKYMGSDSVTKKSDAKETIGRAIGGLILALASVLILQSINPALVELDNVEPVYVEQGDLVAPEAPSSGDSAVKDPREGYWWCYTESDAFFDDTYCLESQSQCEAARSEDDEATDESCREVLAYDDNRVEARESCLLYDEERTRTSSMGDSTYTVGQPQCFSSSGECETRQSEIEDDSGLTLVRECASPEELFEGEEVVSADGYYIQWIDGSGEAAVEIFGEESACETWRTQQINESPEGNYGNCYAGTPENYLQKNVLNNLEAPESTVREMLQDEGVALSKGRCTTVGQNNCINVGGMSEVAQDGLETLNSDFTANCEGDNCTLTVTDATAWWNHGNQQEDPYENGGTCHNPTLMSPNMLCTGAVDLRETQELTNYIGTRGSKNGDWYRIGNNCYLNEDNPDHWHVEFGSSRC